MKHALLALVVLLLATNAQASKRDTQEIYTYQCGSLEDVAKIGGGDVNEITEKDRQSLIDSRKTTLKVIRGGQQAIQDLVKQASHDDSGFGVLLTCGIVVQISEHIKSGGCRDLEKDEIVSAGPGIEICKSMIARVEK